MSYQIRATIGKTDYKTEIDLDEFQTTADEPIELGGQNSAPSPGNYLRASLASCVAITLRMYTKQKGWDVGQISVEIVDQVLDTGDLKLKKVISFENTVTEEQQKRLMNIAEKCPISKILKTGILQGTEIK